MSGPAAPVPPVGDTPRSYFEDRYRDRDDPWGFDTAWYERRKQQLTLALLPRDRYGRAVEPGCANGALTMLLADRCRELLAFDLLPEVAARAGRRTEAKPQVTVVCRDLSSWWPSGHGDLVVAAEVLYYLAQPTLDRVIERAVNWLRPGGHLVAVHYRAETNYPLTAEQIHRTVDTRPDLTRLSTLAEPMFLAGVWERNRSRLQEHTHDE